MKCNWLIVTHDGWVSAQYNMKEIIRIYLLYVCTVCMYIEYCLFFGIALCPWPDSLQKWITEQYLFLWFFKFLFLANFVRNTSRIIYFYYIIQNWNNNCDYYQNLLTFKNVICVLKRWIAFSQLIKICIETTDCFYFFI